MVPYEFHTGVNHYSNHGQQNEPEKHLNHGEKRRFVKDFFGSTFVDKVQHFVGSDVAVCVTDTPFKLLEVSFLLDFADHCHMGFGDNQVGCAFETELLVDTHRFLTVADLSEEDWMICLVNDPKILVEFDHVLVFREKFAQ